MSDFYSKMAGTAVKLLTKRGTTVTLSRTSGSTVDPYTGVETAGTDTSVTTTGLLKRFPDSMIDGTRVQTGDRTLVLTNEQEPTVDDKPIINGQAWSIQSIDTISPAGTDVVYFVHVRR